MGLFPADDPAYRATYAQEAAMIDASELIAEAMEHAGVTPAELARRLDVSRSEIAARLRGERNITVRKLAETLHVLGAELSLSLTLPKPPARTSVAQGWVAPQRDELDAGHDARGPVVQGAWASSGARH